MVMFREVTFVEEEELEERASLALDKAFIDYDDSTHMIGSSETNVSSEFTYYLRMSSELIAGAKWGKWLEIQKHAKWRWSV